MFTEECRAILQNKLPPKLKDLGSFTIPYIIGDVYFNKTLCDLDASINLMPLFIFRTKSEAHHGVIAAGKQIHQAS